jgi:hypothetical protein
MGPPAAPKRNRALAISAAAARWRDQPQALGVADRRHSGMDSGSGVLPMSLRLRAGVSGPDPRNFGFPKRPEAAERTDSFSDDEHFLGNDIHLLARPVRCHPAAVWPVRQHRPSPAVATTTFRHRKAGWLPDDSPDEEPAARRDRERSERGPPTSHPPTSSVQRTISSEAAGRNPRVPASRPTRCLDGAQSLPGQRSSDSRSCRPCAYAG